MEAETFKAPPGAVDQTRFADRVVRPTVLAACLAVGLALAKTLVIDAGSVWPSVLSASIFAIAVAVFALGTAVAWDGHIPGLAWTVGTSPVCALAWLALTQNLFSHEAPTLSPAQATAPLLLGALVLVAIPHLPRGAGYSLSFGVAATMAWAAAGSAMLIGS